MGSYGDNNRHVHIFRSLLDNGRFKNYFINRYADLVNTIFSSEYICLLYTSDAADERSSVDLGGRRIIKKKN